MSMSAPSATHFRVGHDDAGFVTLIARVRPLSPAVVVLEATGGYQVTVAATLAGAVLQVAVEIVGVTGIADPAFWGAQPHPHGPSVLGLSNTSERPQAPVSSCSIAPCRGTPPGRRPPSRRSFAARHPPEAHRFRGLTAWRPGAQKKACPHL
jgi:hypothetical protein